MGDMADWTNEIGEDAAHRDRMSEYEGPEHPDGVIGEVVCPNCGGQMVLRDGRYGKFLGCDNFPRCKGSRNVEWEEEYER